MAAQTVLIVGATGQTGSSVVNGLLESGKFRIIAGVRPSSASKPEVNALKSRGIEIRAVDLENWSVDQLTEALNGVDTVICSIYFEIVGLQRSLVDAAKKAGVKRFIPDDWGTACVPGVRELHDEKLAIHDYIKAAEIGYTFIDVGIWTQVILLFAKPSQKLHPSIPDKFIGSVFGTEDLKTAIADLRDIGKFVARIIADERTLNRYVFCWTEQVTQNEVFALAERVFGKKFESEKVDTEELLQWTKQAENPVEKTLLEYAYSQWIRGDNTIENAKKPEYGEALDARELYPELGKELRTLEHRAKELLSS